MTTHRRRAPRFEVKRRVQHSSPEVRHPPLPTTTEARSGEGPWPTRHRGRRSARRDARHTPRRSAPAARVSATHWWRQQWSSPGGPARSRLRRLGSSGHTSVVRGRDAGALSGAPGPEERSGRGHPAMKPRGDGGAADGKKCPRSWGAARALPFLAPKPAPLSRTKLLAVVVAQLVVAVQGPSVRAYAREEPIASQGDPA